MVDDAEAEQKELETEETMTLAHIAHIAQRSDSRMLQLALHNIRGKDVEIRNGTEGRQMGGKFRPKCKECAYHHVPDPYHSKRVYPLFARDRQKVAAAMPAHTKGGRHVCMGGGAGGTSKDAEKRVTLLESAM
jgi:hypothetical protein